MKEESYKGRNERTTEGNKGTQKKKRKLGMKYARKGKRK